MAKPPIIIDAKTTQSLQRLTQPLVARADNDLSAAAMLSQLHEIAGMLLQEVQLSDAPLAKRLAMAKDLAKLLPMLALAERKVRKGWKGKDVEDMTDRELAAARREYKLKKV